MRNEFYSHLGQFVADFQDIEAEVKDIILHLVNGNDEFVEILINEHSFLSLLRTVDVLFARYIDERGYGVSEKECFHKAIVQCQRLAELRNNLVHSQYKMLVKNNAPVGLVRENSRLSGGKGERTKVSVDLSNQNFFDYFKQIEESLMELGSFRSKIIDWNYP
ncbi:hypothetical protein [Vibrio cholerae]|uniref:hypothetical protein n=1 Tax=Vibrio cholerae TaxID=666 RepID=UPI003075DF11